MSLLLSAFSGAAELLSRVKKAFGKADRSVASPTVFFDCFTESVRISFPGDSSVAVDESSSVDSECCEDMGEEVSSFELSDSPLFSSVEGGEIEEEDSFVPLLSSTHSAEWTGVNTIAFTEDMEEQLSSSELSNSSMFSWMEEDLGGELSSFELSSASLFSSVEGEEMEVENSVVLSFNYSLSEDWNGVNTAFYRIAFVGDGLEGEVSSFEPISSSSLCCVEGVEMGEENCMVPFVGSTPSMTLDGTEKEVFRFAGLEEDFGLEFSSFEPGDISLSSLDIEVKVTSFEEELCASLGQGGEIELCYDEQSSLSPAVVCQPEPAVDRRSGRCRRQPDRFGDWIYY